MFCEGQVGGRGYPEKKQRVRQKHHALLEGDEGGGNGGREMEDRARTYRRVMVRLRCEGYMRSFRSAASDDFVIKLFYACVRLKKLCRT